MDILEVILLIVGIVIFIGSFLLPAGRSDAGRIDTDAAKQEIHGLIEEERIKWKKPQKMWWKRRRDRWNA